MAVIKIFKFFLTFLLLIECVIGSQALAQNFKCNAVRIIEDCGRFNFNCSTMGILSDKIGTLSGVEIKSTVEKCTTISISDSICFDVRYELDDGRG